MSNTIDPNLQSVVNKARQKVSGPETASNADKSGGTQKSGTPAAKGDTVVLTERSQLLESLEKKISGLPEVDRARVEAVKADIENGNYEIDVDNIADILLRSELELGD